MPTVSIITAVRNGASTILSTLQSINEQSHPDIEHVVVDGASTDTTAEIVRTSGLRDLRVISERDSGVYDAFNKGLRLATGEIIGFLNSGDTYWSADSVSRIVAPFADEAMQAVYGDVMIVDQLDTRRPIRRYRSSRFTLERISHGWMPAHPTLFMRRSVYEKFGPYDPSFQIAGDFELVARVFGRGAIRHQFIDEILVRMPHGGLSNKGLSSTYTITREIRRACAKNGIPTNYLKLFSRFGYKLAEYFQPGK
jgi:glycosyltransferase involved in cell wall biosynthesis